MKHLLVHTKSTGHISIIIIWHNMLTLIYRKIPEMNWNDLTTWNEQNVLFIFGIISICSYRVLLNQLFWIDSSLIVWWITQMLRNTVIIFQFETTIYCYLITLTQLTKNQLSINKLIKEKQFTCKNQNISHKFELIIVSIIFVTFFICFYHKNLHTLYTEHPNYILFPFFLSNKNG